MPTAAIITAAGSGKRFGEYKQFKILGEVPLLFHSVKTFSHIKEIAEIILVVPKQNVDEIKKVVRCNYKKNKIKVISGGQHRQESVCNGLNAVSEFSNIVSIHDGAMPFVTEGIIRTNISECKNFDGIVTAIRATDTIKLVEKKIIKNTIERDKVWIAQTPQTFNKKKLIKAFSSAKKSNFLGTDESVLMEKCGYSIKLIEGSKHNLKITNQEDWEYAKTMVERSN